MHHNYSLHCFAGLILVVPLWLTFSLLSKSCSASPCLRFLTIVLRKMRAPLFGSNYCLPHFFSACLTKLHKSICLHTYAHTHPYVYKYTVCVRAFNRNNCHSGSHKNAPISVSLIIEIIYFHI